MNELLIDGSQLNPQQIAEVMTIDRAKVGHDPSPRTQSPSLQ
jgi:hypothetical protein